MHDCVTTHAHAHVPGAQACRFVSPPPSTDHLPFSEGLAHRCTSCYESHDWGDYGFMTKRVPQTLSSTYSLSLLVRQWIHIQRLSSMTLGIISPIQAFWQPFMSHGADYVCGVRRPSIARRSSLSRTGPLRDRKTCNVMCSGDTKRSTLRTKIRVHAVTQCAIAVLVSHDYSRPQFNDLKDATNLSLKVRCEPYHRLLRRVLPLRDGVGRLLSCAAIPVLLLQFAGGRRAVLQVSKCFDAD